MTKGGSVTTFAIVGEGITDQHVIESIVLGCFSDHDEEPEVNYERPLLDRTGLSAKSAKGTKPEPGGWTLVFEYLRLGKHLDALQFNTYLIIHIDTDVCEEPGYDVPRIEDGKALTPRELAGKVVAKLTGIIGAEVYARHRDRFLFAVAVHGIECWLLPLLFPNKKSATAEKIAGCFKTANEELRKKDLPLLGKGPKGQETKDPDAYLAASKPYRRRAKLLELAERNPSLQIFVEQLEALRPPAL